MFIDPWLFCAHNDCITHVEGDGWVLLNQSQSTAQEQGEVQNSALHDASNLNKQHCKHDSQRDWQPGRLLAEVFDGSLKLGASTIAGFVDAQKRSILQFKGSYVAAWPCAHCGGPVVQTVQVSRNLVLACSEAQAQAWENLEAQWEDGTLDADSDTDVVACLESKIDVLNWFEDEMLLSMPMLVRHSSCESAVDNVNVAAEPIAQAALEGQPAGLETRKPFEHLASLLTGGGVGNKSNKV